MIRIYEKKQQVQVNKYLSGGTYGAMDKPLAENRL